MRSYRVPSVLLLVLSFAFASCATQQIRVPVMMPAPVNLVQYDLVAVDRFAGEGCEAFSDQLAAALGGAVNPLTGQQGFEVLHRRDVDRALDQIRDRRGSEWDDRTMKMLDRWRTAQLVLKGVVEQHGVTEQVVEEAQRDRNGNTVVHHTQVVTANVAVHIEATDVDGNRTFDAVTLCGASTVRRPLQPGSKDTVDPQALLAAAREQVVQQYLERVMPHQQWVAVDLYTDGDVPDLQVGNGYAETGNWQAAADAWQRALQAATGELADCRYKVLFNLGVAYEFTDRFAEAKQSLEEAYALGQDRRILNELQRVAAREEQVQQLRAQSLAKPAR